MWNTPVWRGQILLLLEALLQAHELQLGEHGAAAAAFLGLAAAVGAVLQLPPEVQVQRQVVGSRADLQARRRGQQRGAQRAGQRRDGELEEAPLVRFQYWEQGNTQRWSWRYKGRLLEAVLKRVVKVWETGVRPGGEKSLILI